MATWAKGIDFKNSENKDRIGGVGVYGTDTTTEKIYLGLGTEPWSNAGLELTNSDIKFKGNKIYHAGNKPTAAEIGAATASHTHSYLPLSGGTVTSSNFGPLIINRSGSTNAASIYFSNSNGTLGAIGMTASANGGLYRWSADTASSYQILDTGNYKNTVTPANIGAAASSHTHNYLTTKGTNTINSTTNDTTANWGAQGHSVHWYTTAGYLNNQPSQYGFLLNLGTGSEVHQLWMTQSSGNLAHRGGNSSGWNGSWRVLLDSSNYTNYAAAASHTHSYLPLSGGTLTGALTVNANINTTGGIQYKGTTIIRNNDASTIISCKKGFMYLRPNGDGDSTGQVTINLTGNIIANKYVLSSDPNGAGGIGYDSSTTDVYISNTSSNWLRLKADKTMTYAGYKVYTAYQKPTASEVGALATTGGTSSGNISLRNTSSVAGVQFYRGSSTTNYTRLAQADESGNLRIENYSGGSVVGDYVFANGSFSPRRGNPYLGYSTYRWGQVYSTIGSISTSDSRLKENIVAINRSEVRTMSNEPTSYDFYNYIKGTGIYTFNYKKEVSQDTQTWLGILADEIPDNIFEKIGMMSKTEEEYQDELLKQEEAKKILESTPCPLNDDESNDNIIEGTSYTYNELKYEAEKYIEEPIRMINSSSQIAMLQEVLSLALNKIDVLEQILIEKGLLT